MATTAQGMTAANKLPIYQSKLGGAKESPITATPQNLKVDQNLPSKSELNFQNTAKSSSAGNQLGQRGNQRQVMTLQNSHIQGRKVDSPKIYVNDNDVREVRPKTSAQGSRKIKNDKKPPQGTHDASRKNKAPKQQASQNQNKNSTGSCLTIFGGNKSQNFAQQTQKIDFTFQGGKDETDVAVIYLDQDNNSKTRNSEKQSETANKSTSRLQNTQLSKYQQSRQQARTSRPKSQGISGQVQRKRHLSQSMNAGTGILKQSKQVVELGIKSPLNQESNTVNQSANTNKKTQSQTKPNENSRERKNRSTDLNSRPSLAAASKMGMTLKNSKIGKSSQTKGENNPQNTARASGGRQGSETAKEQAKVTNFGREKQHFSFDIETNENKENYLSNSSLLNQNTQVIASEKSKSLSATRGKASSKNKTQIIRNKLSLSSLSRSSPNLKCEASGGSIKKMLGKQYFVDGEQMLRIMSPGTPNKSDDPLKSLVSGAGYEAGKNYSGTREGSPQKGSNYRKKRQQKIRQKSDEGTKRTIDSKSGDRGQPQQKGTTHNIVQYHVKKEHNISSSRHQTTDNHLRQKKTAQDLLKKFMEETQKKTDRAQQRSRDIEKARLQELLNYRSKSKKKRSKSCISKVGEGVFSAREPQKEFSKDQSANQTQIFSDALSGSNKRVKEVSCVVEINQLKKEINEEIRRERQEIAQFPRTAVTPGNQKPQQDQTIIDSQKNKSFTNTLNYTSLRLSDPNGYAEQQKKSAERQKKELKTKQGLDINHSKIRRYIEKQKRKQLAKKSMEETIVHEKLLKTKQTLFDLQMFSRGKERQQPQSIASGPLRLNGQLINFKKVQPTNGKNSTQQIELLNHVRNHLPIKNLRPNHTTKAIKKKKKTNINDSSVFESVRELGDKTNFLDEEATNSQLELTYQQQDLGILNEDSTNINIFSKEISPTISSSKQLIHKHQQSPIRQHNQDLTTEYPLKQLKNKISSKSGQSGSAKGPSKRRQNYSLNIQGDKTQQTITAQSNGTGNFKQSEFESIEHSKPNANEDNKNSKFKTRSTVKSNSDQINNIYDQSAVVNRRQQDIDQIKQQASIQIQKYIRGFISRKALKSLKMEGEKGSPILSSAPLTEKNNTGQSIRKAMNIPSLNLQKINSSDSNAQKQYQNVPQAKIQQLQNPQNQEISSARSTSLFDRAAFQQVKQNVVIFPSPEDIQNIPEFIKIREESIRVRQEQEQKNLQNQLNQNKVSPRTYHQKQRDLEIWVTKEREKVHSQVSKQNAVEKEWERTEQYLKNAYQDHDQINKILGSARSSQKQPPRQLLAEDLLASSARTGLNSFRIDSQRKSHRVEENKIIDLIYDKKDNQKAEKFQQESSSQSKGGKKERQTDSAKLGHSSSQQSHSGTNSKNFESHHSSQRSIHSYQYDQDFENDPNDDEIPNFDKVVVFNQTKKILPGKKSTATEEHTLNRAPSYTRLEDQNDDIDERQTGKYSPKHLSKTDARYKLHDLIDDDEAELARQVMEVSPAASKQSHQAMKEELKESLKSDNFFLKKTDLGAASPKENFTTKNSNIRIEIGDESQPNSQAITSGLIGTVSPLSDGSSNLGIQRGSMSLESSTSGENRERLSQVIEELQGEIEQTTNLNNDQAEFAERLTSEILQLLVAEMRIDFDFLVNRDAAQMLKLQQQQQQDQMGLQQLTGIKTDLFAIEKYVDEIVEEIKQNSTEFLKVLNSPVTKNHTNLLNQLQNTEIGSCEHFSENLPQILPLDLYLTLEKRRKEVREQQQEQTGEKSIAGSQTEMLRILIAECEHIHNKVLFDCINDSLLQFKPYGKEGEPLPWSRKNRRLKPTDDFTINEIFEIVKHDLFRWAITQAGTLPRREFVYRGVFDEELFSEIREKKLVALLGREMIENEPKWLNYEFEQAQVKIDIGDMILELLVTETITILQESGVTEEEIGTHPLMQNIIGDILQEKQNVKPLEPYEAHILDSINADGALKRDSGSGEQSDNSKDSDFSHNDGESNADLYRDGLAVDYSEDDRL